MTAPHQTLYTILCKCLFLEVTVLAVTELNTAAAHRHARCTMHDARCTMHDARCTMHDARCTMQYRPFL
ncbi:hypothetical protein BAB39_001663 [Salmonella enterica subsp. enterica serovar Carrau]|nr:hypothetical protein [Salmonella enterica subsp. enterica serovar Carrau]